jgi:putative tryptophan/tyrosine transport system substrate-binding protein
VDELDAFFLEYRRCGEAGTGVEDGHPVIDRRTFLAGTGAVLLAAPLTAEAQQAGGKVYRIGMLETRSIVLNAANIDTFRHGLLELGYKEGQNLEIVYRSSDGRDERFPGLASELVRLQVDLIVTRGTPAALAAKRATQTIPVVMAASADPVGSGLVASLGRPGGNVTGLSSALTEVYAKRVELLSEVLPKLARVAAIFNMGNPVTPSQWHVVEASARSLGIKAQLLDVRRPEDLGGHSIRQRSSGPRRSLWDSTASRRGIYDLSLNLRQGSGCPRFMGPRSMRMSEG